MGCTATDNGISIQFCTEDGKPDGAPLYGRYTRIFGKRRELVIAAGAAQTRDESDFKGSDDWLTLIAVADTPEKLEEIVHESNVPSSAPDTSCSSRRVQIELHIAGVRQTYKDRITLASGPIVQISPKPIIDVVHVKVLPAGAVLGDLKPDSRLVREFNGGAIAFQ
jgi:hypothetical protein